MSGDPSLKAARKVEPLYSTVAGRTWLTYSELDDPDLLHGIVVFRDLGPDVPYAQWTDRVRSYLRCDTPIAGLPVIFGRQVHGTRVGIVTRREVAGEPEDEGSKRGVPLESLLVVEPAGTQDFDAIVASEREVTVAVTVSDCLPLFGTSARAIGVAHCGWRGVAAGIVEEFVRSLAPNAGDRDMRFLIGAGIGPCCYEVREDMIAAFGPDAARYCATKGGRTTFDLKAAVRERLVASGVSPDRILIDQTCTSCRRDVLTSYRAEAGDCGRMVAFLARPERKSRSEPEANRR